LLSIFDLSLPRQWLIYFGCIHSIQGFKCHMQYLHFWWTYIIICIIRIANVNETTLLQYLLVVLEIIEYYVTLLQLWKTN
jgi:hypothetical protein